MEETYEILGSFQMVPDRWSRLRCGSAPDQLGTGVYRLNRAPSQKNPPEQLRTARRSDFHFVSFPAIKPATTKMRRNKIPSMFPPFPGGRDDQFGLLNHHPFCSVVESVSRQIHTTILQFCLLACQVRAHLSYIVTHFSDPGAGAAASFV